MMMSVRELDVAPKFGGVNLDLFLCLCGSEIKSSSIWAPPSPLTRCETDQGWDVVREKIIG